MREVTAHEPHACEYCKAQINIGEQCIQAEGRPYGRFWHVDCAPSNRNRVGWPIKKKE